MRWGEEAVGEVRWWFKVVLWGIFAQRTVGIATGVAGVRLGAVEGFGAGVTWGELEVRNVCRASMACVNI